jgi:hypothetical protein
MGVTIHYRGTMDDQRQVETMEDRILDLVFSLGGRATIWRSFSERDSSRVVRGLIVNLEPGQDTLSLLVSPEGHLIPLFQIEDAEKAPFEEPPYCFIKSQFGSLQGHIAIIHLLDALRQQYFSNLEISDEGEYYESRDVRQLSHKISLLRSAIHAMSEGLKEHGLSAEAAEDPNILASRIERIAALVQEKMLAERNDQRGPANRVPNEEWGEPSLEDEVDAMDRLRRHSDLRSERMTRRIAEATASGLSVEAAFELAMEEEGLTVPTSTPDQRNNSEPCEPWLESLPSHSFNEASELSSRLDHPAVVQAQAFLMQVMNLEQDSSQTSSFSSTLMRSSLDIVGGLVQATSDEVVDNVHRALTISQLKRALSGHAYARGAICGLRGENRITKDQSQQLHGQLQSLLEKIHALFEAAWT